MKKTILFISLIFFFGCVKEKGNTQKKKMYKITLIRDGKPVDAVIVR